MEEHPFILIHLIDLLLSFKKSAKVLWIKSKYTDTDTGYRLNAVAVFGLGKDFLFKSILGRCDVVINVNAILHRHWLQSGSLSKSALYSLVAK